MSLVRLERSDAVAVITLDDGKANALRPALLLELEAALDAAEGSGAGAVVIAGRPGFYSGGLDLKLLPTMSSAEKVETFHHFGRLLLRVAGFGLPTVGALTGHAIAGGALLALATDVRLAARGGKIGVTEVALGLPLPTFGLEIARSAIPAHLLAEAVLHGRVYAYEEAAQRGIVEAALPAEELLGAATERATALARIPDEAYAITKDRLRGQALRESLARLEGEVAGFVRVFEERFTTGGR